MKYSASSVWESKDAYDIAVIGAGHAGCEAALASARLGFQTVLFTVSMDSVALMPCNPNIGGSSKGHLVRFQGTSGAGSGRAWRRDGKSDRPGIYPVKDAQSVERPGSSFPPGSGR